MSTVSAQVQFDIKSLGLLANQDAGVRVDGAPFQPCDIQYLTNTGVAFRIDTSKITTYGGGSFKTGPCCGFLALKDFSNSSFQGPIFVSPTFFDEIKVGSDAYFRFNFLTQETVTGFVYSSVPI